MDLRTHWEKVYLTHATDQVGWYRPHLETSLAMIERAAGVRALPAGSAVESNVLDVGGGRSTLADDLLMRGYRNLSVLDISATAIEAAKERLRDAASAVHWMVADIITANLPTAAFDIWHDRAVFHFLTAPEQRRAYVERLTRCLKPGGRAIVATFGPQGPAKCSGLDVRRYDSASLLGELGERFHLTESLIEMHRTPFGTEQQFVYSSFRLE